MSKSGVTCEQKLVKRDNEMLSISKSSRLGLKKTPVTVY